MLTVLAPITPTVSSSVIAEPDTAYDPTGIAVWAAANIYALDQYAYYNHVIYQSLVAHQGLATSASATVTMTIAVPGVVTWTAHGLANGAAVKLTTTGVLPTGLTNGTTYYVTAKAADTFQLAATLSGAAITTTGSQSGTHTATVISTQPDTSVLEIVPKWVEIRPTNKYAMLDARISTATRLQTTVPIPALVITVTPGQVCNGAALLDISGATSCKIEMFDGATTVFSSTQTMDNTFISDWYMYFFEPFDIKTDLLFGPMPPYPSATVTVTVTPTSVGTVVSLGAAMFGYNSELGEAEYGATAGIIDYSRKETDVYGVTTFVERGFAKRTNYQIMVEQTQLRRVFGILAALRATPAVWVASDDYNMTPLTVFGWCKDFSINVQYPTQSAVSIEIEGLL